MAPGSSLGSTPQCPEHTLSLGHRARSWPHRLPDVRPPRRESARPPGLAGLTPPPLAQSDCRRGVPRTPPRSPVQKCIIGFVPLDEYGPNRTCGCGHEQMAPRTAWASHSTQLREEPQEGLTPSSRVWCSACVGSVSSVCVLGTLALDRVILMSERTCEMRFR